MLPGPAFDLSRAIVGFTGLPWIHFGLRDFQMRREIIIRGRMKRERTRPPEGLRVSLKEPRDPPRSVVVQRVSLSNFRKLGSRAFCSIRVWSSLWKNNNNNNKEREEMREREIKRVPSLSRDFFKFNLK